MPDNQSAPTLKEVLPKANTSAAVYFLQQWPGFPVISAARTDPVTGKKGMFETKSFGPPTDWDAVAKWIDARQGKSNLYFSVNPLINAIDKKAERTDIARLVALHIDVDVRPGEDQVAGIDRIVKMFEAYKVPPSLIINSGGGAQAFWMLDPPLELGGDLVKAEDAKLYNIQIERDLQGDNCHNIDRVMRLPGTINVPNAVKLKKGRKPSVAAVVMDARGERKYPLSKFSKAMKVQEANETPAAGPTKGITIKLSGNFESMDPNDERLSKLAPKWRIIGFKGDQENVYGGDRSKALFAWVTQCVRAKIADDVMASCIMDPDWVIGECVREKKNVDRELNRVIERGHMLALDGDDDLGRMNEKYAVVNIQGKTRVMTQAPSAIYADRWLPQYSTFDDFQNLHSNVSKEWVDKDGETHSVPLGTWWIKNKQRRQYNDGLRYIPHNDAEIVGEALNLWTGFTVAPKKGDCSLYLKHMKDNVCAGNEENYQYLLKLMAHTVQFRGQPRGVAVCLRGGKGTGKSFFIKMFGRMYGQHFLAVTNAEHLTGKFNQHLETISVLFADECFFAGDKKHEQILKVLITESEIIIEPKGVNAYQAPNYLTIFMASNSDWIVPASSDERRYFVLDVGEGAKQNSAYFKAIQDQMDNGGQEALLEMLLGLDLNGFDVRKVPQTTGLAKQKALSRKGADAVMEQLLTDGIIPHAHESMPDVAITTEDQHGKSFIVYVQKNYRDLSFFTPPVITKLFKDKWGAVPWKSGNRRGLRFPPLAEGRATFVASCGAMVWPDEDEQWGGGKPSPSSGKGKDKDWEIPF